MGSEINKILNDLPFVSAVVWVLGLVPGQRSHSSCGFIQKHFDRNQNALLGAFSVITNLRMDLFEALVQCPLIPVEMFLAEAA